MPGRARALWLLPLLLLLVADCVSAQNRSLLEFYRSPSMLSREGVNRLSQAASEAISQQQQLPISALAPLEGAVDADQYKIGPNDVFSVSIGGAQPIQAQVPVGSDGTLVLPTVGALNVAGLPLSEARAIALDTLSSSFRNVPVDVALLQPRSFYVHVSGAVPEPGRYLALPASRVEDVLKQAFFSVTFEDPVADARFRPALRNVLVRRADGSEVPVDMVAYYTGGERDANPYVMDGDVVYVPAFRPAISGVFVSGEVPFAGAYDYRDGDTVLDLLRLAAGPSGLEALGSVRLARTGEADQNLRIADLLRAESKGEAGVPVRALDNLHVPEPEARPATATAAGFVRYPGVYPIEAGQTTLAEFIARAGGFREDALVRGAYLERGATIEERRAVDFMQQPNIGRLPFLVDTSAVLQQTRLGDLDVLGRLYLARALSSENRVSVDVASALGGGGEPVVLYGGDRLVVPRDEQSVRVIGEVEQPGAVPFQASLNAEGYISRAGGRGGKSADVFVIKAGTGQLVEAKRATVESGDIVFVNRAGGDPINTDEQRLALQQLDRRNRNFQLVLQTIGVAASIGTTVAVIFNVFGRD